MPAQQTEVTTIEGLLALPEDGVRHELLEGEHVVTPAPRLAHQRVLTNLVRVFHETSDVRDDQEFFISPADVRLGPNSLVQPDLFVVAKEPNSVLEAWSDIGIPILAVEILSPSTASRDRGKKRRIYQKAGVREYWIVDIDARILERWNPDDIRPEILSSQFDWELPDGSRHRVDLTDIFRSIPPAE